jgi:hypothetical protein
VIRPFIRANSLDDIDLIGKSSALQQSSSPHANQHTFMLLLYIARGIVGVPKHVPPKKETLIKPLKMPIWFAGQSFAAPSFTESLSSFK